MTTPQKKPTKTLHPCVFCETPTTEIWTLTTQNQTLSFCDTCHSHMQNITTTQKCTWSDAAAIMIQRLFRHILIPAGFTPARLKRHGHHQAPPATYRGLFYNQSHNVTSQSCDITQKGKTL